MYFALGSSANIITYQYHASGVPWVRVHAFHIQDGGSLGITTKQSLRSLHKLVTTFKSESKAILGKEHKFFFNHRTDSRLAKSIRSIQT